MFWQEFFSVYPFTQDREDLRHAEFISYMSFVSSQAAEGKHLKKPIPIGEILPDYLGERQARTANKSLEQQQQEFTAFHSKLKALQGRKQNGS